MSEEKRRSKRQSAGDEGFWECSMCTYRNPPEFFKCEICECRKGTSTRRPRVTSQVVAQQVAQSFLQPPPKKERREKKERKERSERVEVSPSVSSVDQDRSVDGDLEAPDNTETKPELLCREDSVEGEREEPDIPESQPSEYVPPPAPPKLKKEASTSKPGTPTHSTKCNTAKKSKSSGLKNIDRSSAQSMEVTVNNITVVITDYQLKKDSKVTNSTTSTISSAAANHTERFNSSTQQALHDQDGESKDSFSSSIADNSVQSGGETEQSSTGPCAVVES